MRTNNDGDKERPKAPLGVVAAIKRHAATAELESSAVDDGRDEDPRVPLVTKASARFPPLTKERQSAGQQEDERKETARKIITIGAVGRPTLHVGVLRCAVVAVAVFPGMQSSTQSVGVFRN